MFEIVKKEFVLFYEKVLVVFVDMENDWIEVGIDDIELLVDIEVGDINNLKVFVVGVVFVIFFFWLLLLVVGIGIVVVFVGFFIVLSLVVILFMKFFGRDVRKRKIIDEEFNNCCNLVRSFICNEFEVNCVGVMNKLIDKVMKDLLFKWI